MDTVNETRALEGVASGAIIDIDIDGASIKMMARELLELRQLLPVLRYTFSRNWDDVRTVSGKPSSTQRADAYMALVEAADAAALPLAGS